MNQKPGWDERLETHLCARCGHSHIVHKKLRHEKGLLCFPHGRCDPKGYMKQLGGNPAGQPDCDCPGFVTVSRQELLNRLAELRNGLSHE